MGRGSRRTRSIGLSRRTRRYKSKAISSTASRVSAPRPSFPSPPRNHIGKSPEPRLLKSRGKINSISGGCGIAVWRMLGSKRVALGPGGRNAVGRKRTRGGNKRSGETLFERLGRERDWFSAARLQDYFMTNDIVKGAFSLSSPRSDCLHAGQYSSPSSEPMKVSPGGRDRPVRRIRARSRPPERRRTMIDIRTFLADLILINSSLLSECSGRGKTYNGDRTHNFSVSATHPIKMFANCFNRCNLRRYYLVLKLVKPPTPRKRARVTSLI